MKKCVDLLNTKEYSLLIDTTFKNNDLPNVNPKYVRLLQQWKEIKLLQLMLIYTRLS